MINFTKILYIFKYTKKVTIFFARFVHFVYLCSRFLLGTEVRIFVANSRKSIA